MLTGHVDEDNGNTQTEEVLVIRLDCISILVILNVLTEGELVMTPSMIVSRENPGEEWVRLML